MSNLLYNFSVADIDYKLMSVATFPHEADALKGLCQNDWSSGATVTEPCISFSVTGGGVTSSRSLCSTPALLTRLKCSDWTQLKIVLTNSSNNGYMLTFPTDSSLTKVVLSRVDAGSATELASVTLDYLFNTTHYIDIDWIIADGVIAVGLFNDIILQSDDTTYRLTNWQLKLQPVESSCFLYCQKWHYLQTHTSKLEVKYSLCDTARWTSGIKSDGYITLASGYNCFYTGLILPKEGFDVQVTFSTVTGTHNSKWGIVSRDKSLGVYAKWNSGVFYLTKADDTTLASGGSPLNTSTSLIRVNSLGDSKIYAECGETSLHSNQISNLCSPAILHFQDISANQDIVITSIDFSINSTLYGFTTWTAESVIKKSRSLDPIIPY